VVEGKWIARHPSHPFITVAVAARRAVPLPGDTHADHHAARAA
jgi:hypothetical protein